MCESGSRSGVRVSAKEAHDSADEGVGVDDLCPLWVGFLLRRPSECCLAMVLDGLTCCGGDVIDPLCGVRFPLIDLGFWSVASLVHVD
ncbi:hypothetical protein SUGI_0475150 [Cryptomeria japonica]|nr:hypothetical protein SUGI_0475150 [Cryptomeria japonica]